MSCEILVTKMTIFKQKIDTDDIEIVTYSFQVTKKLR
jgi:hypothetical protein